MGSRRRSTNGDTTNEESCPVDAGLSEGVSPLAVPYGQDTRPSRRRNSRSASRTRRRRLIFENLGQRRVLAVITGSIFHDVDQSMRRDPAEAGLESRLAFIDSNDNATLDAGEPFAIADSDGEFRFDDLAPGTYPVRLFDGSGGQRQTFPTGAIQNTLPARFASPIDAVYAGDQINVLANDTLLQIEASGTRTSQFPLGFESTALVASILTPESPSGSASIIAGNFSEQGEGRSGIWLVPAGGQRPRLVHYDPSPLSLANPSAAVGPDGHGVVIAADPDSGDGETILAIRVSRAASEATPEGSLNVQVTATGVNVPAGAQVLGSSKSLALGSPQPESAVGSRTVFAWPAVDSSETDDSEPSSSSALIASLWSNTGGGWIAGSETVIDGATELVSFDDDAGLLAVRYAEGGIGILDVDAGFAPIQQFEPSSSGQENSPESSGPASLIIGENALVSIEPSGLTPALLLHDATSGTRLARHTIDASDIGEPFAVIPGESINAHFVVGSNGVLFVELEQPVAHEVEVTDDEQEVEIEFGMLVDGENSIPDVPELFELNATEDQRLTIDADEIATQISDADQDRLIALVAESPKNGTVNIRDDGSIDYLAKPNFNGTDSFSVQIHDGQSVSRAVQFAVVVASVPDVPTGLRFRGNGVPEHTVGPRTIGSIEVDDVDLDGDYSLDVLDSRFRIEDRNLVLVSDGLNYEFENEIHLSVTGYDADARAYFTDEIVVFVEDENDPVSDLYADAEVVLENDTRAFVAYLGAFDEDENQTITFSVDDDRFEAVGDKLWLKEGESLDYESESVVVLTVTADDNAGSTASTELRVSVGDLPEQIGEITLSNETVIELEPGATVGDVQLDGVVAADSYRLTVDDSRFEIDGSELKLLDDQFVRRSAAEQIELTITAQDTSSVFEAVSATFVIEVLENETPFHNDENPYDVDGNGEVTPLDALAIINYLNIYGPGPVGPGDPGYGYDVNGDGQVTTLDALLIINIINSIQNGGSIVGGGGNPPANADAEAPETSQDDAPADPPLATNESSNRMTDVAAPTNDPPAITAANPDAAESEWVESVSPQIESGEPDMSEPPVDESIADSSAIVASATESNWLQDDDEDDELSQTVDELAIIFSKKS